MLALDVDALTIRQLRDALIKANLQSGPVTASTESVYRQALLRYMTGLNNESGQSALNDSNTLEYADSSSDLEDEEDGDQFAEQPTLADALPLGKKPFVAVRWNPVLKIYEALSDEPRANLQHTSGGDPFESVSWKYVLLIAGAVFIIAVILHVMFLSGDYDPYAGLERAASHQRAQSEGLEPGEE